MYDTRKAFFYANYNSFRDNINNVSVSVNDIYTTFHNGLENLDKEFEVPLQSPTYIEDGFDEEYERRRTDYYERLNMQLAGILIMLNTNFENELKKAFNGISLRSKIGDEQFFIRYCEYIEKHLGVNLSDDFYVTFKRFTRLRNKFGHEGVDLNISDTHIQQMIKDMAIEIRSLIKAVYDSLYKKHIK